MKKGIKNFLGGLVAFFIIGLIFFGLIYIGIFLDKKRCEEQYKDSIYSFYGGCKISYEGEYIAEELYKNTYFGK